MKTIKYNSERYERIRVLGQGSFGTAIVHRRRPDCALVVLKEIDLLKFKDERERINALQEARIMSELCHDNIIKYYNAYATETKLIIEMEYARLGTLQTYLSLQNQLLEEAEILCIFRQILSGICYLHSKNIVHLDLKMANVFVSSEGTIKIGDFGIAQFMPKTNQDNANSNNNNNAQQQQLGTLAYSSPERCLGLVSNPIRSDIWSLGCILYELITLEPLFSSESLAEMVVKITRIHYKPIDRNIVASMKHLFERMISRDADDRPDADELILEVDQILEHIERLKQRANEHKNSRRHRHHQPRIANRHHNKLVDVSTDAAFFAQDKRNLLTQINYPHSLIYQVRLNTNQISVDRVNLPQSKRIKEISKGRSHYLVLTYDNIVYGWGSRNRGQLGACNLITSLDLLMNDQQQSRDRSINKSLQLRSTRSATNSFTAADLMTTRNLLLTGGQRASLTQPSSLASSTQTIIAATSANITNSTSQVIGKSQMNAGETSLGQGRLDLLDEAEPVSKPFIINELNKRKIERVAAGNDFSVFLSKTGIVMTCGDGSTGCLGRGDLKVSVSPCMVDNLLNMDVVDIACGPEHVVAICGDGQVFTWGNINHGRLGISTETLNGSDSYVALPQQVKFKLSPSQNQSQGSNVFITSAVCGDRCTIFIDSNYNCWACGENRHNKLGLDIKRRFKKTIVIRNAYRPAKITALSKYKIIACKIGKNHSSFLTLDGKMLVFGQDIDHSYRLRANRIFNRESHRRTSYELKTNSNRRKQQLTKNQRANQAQVSGYGYASKRTEQKCVNYKYLANCLLTNNQLIGYKSSQFDQRAMVQVYPRLKTTNVQRHQLESYMKKTRSNKKMPFSSVISMSCTSKFTLALTNDNRVYFWGTRSYERSDSEYFTSDCPRILNDPRNASINRKWSPKSSEPQLVSSQHDECFVKIGPTNSTLMTNIQLMGSDQPILQARDPRLIANSLADLWILDYQPESSSTSECSSHSSCSSLSSFCSNCDTCCSSCPSESSPSSCQSNYNPNQYSKQLIDHSDCKFCQKHDAILEPQPIVSLYVPSMFNHNGSTLKLVNLFCFDEDSFFLIIDTNISFQQQQSVQKHQQISNNNTTSRSQMKRSSAQTSTQHFNHFNIVKNRSNSIVTNHPSAYNSNLMQRRGLDLVEESNSNSSSQEAKIRRSLQDNELNHPVNIDSLPDGMNIIKKSPLIEGNQTAHQELSSPPDCCRQVQGEADASFSALDCLDEFGSSPKSITQYETGEQSQGLHQTPTSNGFSLEEPRSMSTFIAALGNHIVVAGPTLNRARTGGESMRKLSFGNDDDDDDDEHNLPFGDRRKRRQRYQRNQSESTAATGDDLDETSVMPTWVRDEFIQQEQASRPVNFNSCQDIGNQILSSEESDGNEPVASSLDTLVTAHNKSCDNLASGQQVVYNNGTSSSSFVGEQTNVVYCNNDDIIVTKCDRRVNRPRDGGNLSNSMGDVTNGRPTVSLFTDDLRLLSKSQPDLRDDSASPRRASDKISGQSNDYLIISQNIIDCSVYKSSKDQQADKNSNHSNDLQDLRELQSYSDLSSLLSRQDTIKSVCHSTRSLMRVDDEVIVATTISQDLSATKKRQILRSSVVDRYSSSCADFRDSDRCTTVINQEGGENYRQRRESSGSISRHEQQQQQQQQQQREFGVARQRLAAFDSYDLSRYNRVAALGRPESRSSLSSIRKSLMKIFC